MAGTVEKRRQQGRRSLLEAFGFAAAEVVGGGHAFAAV